MGAARKMCGVAKGRKGSQKQTGWWNDEVKGAVALKKVMYRRLLDLGTEKLRKSTMKQRQRQREWWEELQMWSGFS